MITQWRIVVALLATFIGQSRSEMASLPRGVDEKPMEWLEQEKLLLQEPELKDSLKSGSDRQFYELNPQKLKQMWHAAMVRSLLKSKAKVLLSDLPTIERIVYQQCESDAKSLVQVARCLVRLLDERDRAQAEFERIEQLKKESHGNSPSPYSSIVSPSSPFYQLTPFFDMFTARPAPPPVEPPNIRPTFAIKSFYSTNAVAERINEKDEEPSSSHIEKGAAENRGPARPDRLPSAKGVNSMATVEFSVDEGVEESSKYKTDMHISPYKKVKKSRARQHKQLKIRKLEHKLHHKHPVRSHLSVRPLRKRRERRMHKKQRRIVEADQFRTKRSTHLTIDTIDEAFEQFLRENRDGADKETLGTNPINSHSSLLSGFSAPELISPRYVALNETRKRSKRNLPQPTTTKIGFGSLAKRYLQQFIGNKLTGRPSDNDGNPMSRLSNSEKLQLIKEHFSRVEKCNQYFKLMSQENQGIINRLGIPIDTRSPRVAASDEQDIMEGVMSMVNDFADDHMHNEGRENKDSKWSILSPKMFSLFPNTRKVERMISKGQILSPNLFSFHKDGLFSIPDIFNILTVDRSSQSVMLDMLLDLSGASLALDDAISKLEKEIHHTRDYQYPLVQELSKLDYAWIQARKTYTPEQLKQIEERGYAFLEPHQLRNVYGEKISDIKVDLDEYGRMSEREREERIERDIRKLANMGELRKKHNPSSGDSISGGGPDDPMGNDQPPHSRIARSAPASEPEGGEGEHPVEEEPREAEGGEEHERINGVIFETLQPFAFTNIINHGGALEVVTLSPHAFVSEILVPEALILSTLSPRAFIATVLSPAALVARILSPTAFRAEVLAPRALYTWILSPEAMVAEVLSPHVLEPRVLSPEFFIINVLSPQVLAPKVGSPERFSVLVLSPHILSPRIASDEKYVVEVLSPHILGGPHNKEEEEETVISIGGGHPEHEGEEKGGANHPAHGPEAAWDLNGGGHQHGR